MPYNNVISRTDAAALIPEDVAAQITMALPTMNPVMQLARRLPNMSTAQQRMPVLSSFASAYFVNGDNGLRQTSEVNWANKYIDAEELAVIVSIPENVLDDAQYPIWDQVRPEVEKAFSRAITAAVLYGTNIPASWTTNLGGAGLLAVANTASQVVSAAAYTDLYEALLGETAAGVGGVFMQVEADGFMPTGVIANTAMYGKLRNMRDSNGNPMFNRSIQDRTRYEIDGVPCYFPTDGTVAAASSLLFAGQWDQLVYAMRQDITWKILDQAVIQDAGGNIIYNLAQQDMVALRAVMRLGFALPNPLNYMQATAANRCAFSVLTA